MPSISGILDKQGKKNVAASNFKASLSAMKKDQTAVEIDMDKIIDMPDNDYFFPQDPETIENLKKRITQDGFRDPIIVVPNEDGATYTCLSGHQRRAAAAALGMHSVPAYIQRGMTEDQKKNFFISANMVVRRISPLSVARIADASMKEYEEKKKAGTLEFRGDKRAFAAERCQIGKTQVLKFVAILRMPEDIQLRCREQDFPYTSLYEARDFTDQQKEMLSNRLKQRDIDHPNLIISKKELDRIIEQIRMDTAYEDVLHPEKYEIHTGEDTEEVSKLKEKSFQQFKQQIDSEIGTRTDSPLIDEPFSELAKELYKLAGGSILVGNDTKARNNMKLIELCLKNIDAKINRK